MMNKKQLLKVSVAFYAFLNVSFVAPLPYKTRQTFVSSQALHELFQNEEKDKNNAPKSTLKGWVQALPNENIDLNADVVDKHVILTWTVEEKQTIKKFIIQHSTDLEHFIDLAEVKANKGKDLQTFVDETPSEGYVNYYRILAVSPDKALQVFSPIAATVETSKGDLYGVSLHLSDDSEMIRIKLDGLQDSEVLLSTVSGMGVPCEVVKKSATELIVLPSYTLASGEYLVKIRGEKEEKKYRIIVKKSDKMF
ncbi:hypothetical protein [Flectobacillus major]|uniref:hypothetical protein n=1 Tax=Flectobacillus major TaxID=103 RepID=UPI00040CE20E|nr:hypothetical protein [Flectobacillus major]